MSSPELLPPSKDERGNETKVTGLGPKKRSTVRHIAPWLTLALGVMMFVVGVLVAFVAFSRALSPASFGATLLVGISGNESAADKTVTLILILVVAAATATFGAMAGLSSIFVLTRRGTRRVVAGARQAATTVKSHEIGDQARRQVSVGKKALEEQRRHLGSTLRSRYVSASRQVKELPPVRRVKDKSDE